MWLSIDLLPCGVHTSSEADIQTVRTLLMDGCFQKLFAQVKPVPVQSSAWTRGWRWREKGSDIAKFSNLGLRPFRSSRSSRQCEGLSRTNPSSPTWPNSQHSECGWRSWSEHLLSIHWFPPSTKEGPPFIVLCGCVALTSWPADTGHLVLHAAELPLSPIRQNGTHLPDSILVSSL